MRLHGVVVGIALLALAAAACSGGSGDSDVPEASASLRVLTGTVEVQPPSAGFALAVDGQALEEGYTIRTGADGRAAIEYFDGSVTRLDENTTFTIVTLQILDNADQSKVIEGEQSSGSTYNRVTELTDSASRFDVTTPTATASVQGTIYAIFVNPVTGVTTVAVLDGTVVTGGASVPAGFMVTVDEDGNASDPVPIPDDLIDSDWIVFNCEQDGGVVDADGNCVLGTPTTTTTTVAETTTTTVAETTTTTVAETTTTSTTTTTLPHATTTTTSTTTTTTTTVPSVLDHIVISPDAEAVEAGETLEFFAEAFDQFDSSMGMVAAVFDIDGTPCDGSNCGSTEAGVYAITGTFEGESNTATLTVVPGSIDYIVISPAEATVAPNEPVEYSAEGFDEYDNSLGEVDADFEIADGSCEGSSCASSEVGDHEVTGTYSEDEDLYDTATLTVVVGGPVAVSLYWENAADMDLHVTEPSGEEIAYYHTTSATGGHLSHDSQCYTESPHSEVISWVLAPFGSYSVTVVTYSLCEGSVAFTLTISVNDESVGTFDETADYPIVFDVDAEDFGDGGGE